MLRVRRIQGVESVHGVVRNRHERCASCTKERAASPVDLRSMEAAVCKGGMMMDGNLAVLIAMIALMIGGAVLLNLQIKHDAKKEKEQKGKQ